MCFDKCAWTIQSLFISMFIRFEVNDKIWTNLLLGFCSLLKLFCLSCLCDVQRLQFIQRAYFLLNYDFWDSQALNHLLFHFYRTKKKTKLEKVKNKSKEIQIGLKDKKWYIFRSSHCSITSFTIMPFFILFFFCILRRRKDKGKFRERKNRQVTQEFCINKRCNCNFRNLL